MFHSAIDLAPLVRQRQRRAALGSLVVILLSAFVLRAGQFGNPIAGLDEQFYLLAGDRLLAGELPYIDVWDRKPVGLFVLFAGIRLLPGDGVLAAQVVATVFAAATGWLVALIVQARQGWMAATLAGIFYVAAAGELWADTTQTPIFFNAPVAAAAWLTLRAIAARRVRAAGAIGAMALCGLAIQIKTNAIFPGLYFAGWLLWTARAGRSPAALTGLAGAMAVAGALPTLAAMASYAANGAFDAWWQANVVSVLAKGRPDDPAVIDTFWETTILFAPVAALALIGVWRWSARFTVIDPMLAFMLGWVVVGIVDFVAIGGYFPHYAMPLLLAAVPLVAAAFAIPRLGALLFALVMAWPIAHDLWLNPRVTAKEAAFARAVTSALPDDVRTRCLFIYEGPVIYYHLTQACRVTRYAFTAHLSSRRESRSLGVDAAAELDATMARAPGTVLTVAGSRWRDRNPAMERRLARHLARDYRLVALLPYRLNPEDGRLAMWRRR